MFKLVTAIVVLCRDLDALVVAEGIETIEELEAVSRAGAHYGQGYLLARPRSRRPRSRVRLARVAPPHPADRAAAREDRGAQALTTSRPSSSPTTTR